MAGDLAAGKRLPSSRTLASELNISRTTAIAVFERLASEGLIDARTGSGSYVAATANPHRPRAPLIVHNERPATTKLADLIAEASPKFFQRLAHPYQPRAFITGLPDYKSFPMAVWSRLSAKHWREPREFVMGYSDPTGIAPLRQAIADHLRGSRGIACDAEQIFIVNGAQQAFDLIGRVLLKPRRPGVVRESRRHRRAQFLDCLRRDDDPRAGRQRRPVGRGGLAPGAEFPACLRDAVAPASDGRRDEHGAPRRPSAGRKRDRTPGLSRTITTASSATTRLPLPTLKSADHCRARHLCRHVQQVDVSVAAAWLLPRAPAAGADLPADFGRLPAWRAVEHPGDAGCLHRRWTFRHASAAHARKSIASGTGIPGRGGKAADGLARLHPSVAGFHVVGRFVHPRHEEEECCRMPPKRAGHIGLADRPFLHRADRRARGLCSASAPSIRAASARASKCWPRCWSGTSASRYRCLPGSSRLPSPPPSVSGHLCFPKSRSGKSRRRRRAARQCHAPEAGCRQPNRAGTGPMRHVQEAWNTLPARARISWISASSLETSAPGCISSAISERIAGCAAIRRISRTPASKPCMSSVR